MKKPKLKHLLIGGGILIAAVWSMGQYDYSRLIDGNRPVFARIQLHASDGGSTWYLGPGYTVISLHHRVPDVLPWGTVSQERKFCVGPTLDYWTPFCSREQIRFITITDR